MSDLIEREVAFDALVNKGQASTRYKLSESWELNSQEIREALNTVPPAQPERKIGRWVSQKGGGYCCSECGRYALDEVDGNFIHVAFESNFCPYCGAKMVGK